MSTVKQQTEPITITSTVDELLQQLRDSYTAAAETLEKERADLESESEGILKKANELRLPLPAQAREAQRQADKLLLAGKPEEAAAKYALQRQAESVPGKLEDRRRTIAARIYQISDQKEAQARRVFNEWYPSLRAALVGEQLAMVDALDKGRDEIAHFAVAHGLAQVGGVLKTGWEGDLTARDRGSERPLFERLRIWFGGRR
jgi:hypothetical protein